jgi:hypothetical protein
MKGTVQTVNTGLEREKNEDGIYDGEPFSGSKKNGG